MALESKGEWTSIVHATGSLQAFLAALQNSWKRGCHLKMAGSRTVMKVVNFDVLIFWSHKQVSLVTLLLATRRIH